VPFLVAERGLGYVAVSGITLAATLLSSVVQPVFGVLTDRRPLTWLIPVAMTTAGLGIALVGVGPSYWLSWLAAGGLSLTPLLMIPALFGAAITQLALRSTHLVAPSKQPLPAPTTGRRSCGCRRS
jgi:MFS family permease